jgi:prevent-host-death family protein
MSSVSIADLKARLSHYVRLARSGRTVTVKNRSEEVARLVPPRPNFGELSVRPPEPGAPPPGRLPLPRSARLRRDAVALLLEDRRGER